MNGKVDKLYDIDSIAIPEELLKVSVDEQRIEEEVGMLSLRYARESLADAAAESDLVYAKADQESYPDGRTILLYTAMNMPGAEKAAKAVIGKKAGDVVSTVLADKKVTLTVEKVLHREPVEVTDELIAGMGIEGVADVETYKAYLREKMTADKQMENNKEIVRHILDEMTANSTYSYDEEEAKAQTMAMAEQYQKEYEQMGETVTVEEICEGMIAQEKQMWMAKAVCESKGIDVDTSSAEEDADRMIEMMQLTGEPVPDREEMIQMAVQDAYFTGLMSYIDNLVQQKMGGSNGNS